MPGLEKRFGRILIPLVTPFAPNEDVNESALRRLIDYLVGRSLGDSLIVAGTTGEFYALDHDERLRLFAGVHDAARQRWPLIAGVGAATTREAARLAQAASEIGYDALMVVSPYYQKATQEGLYRHFKSVADATRLPVMLYNIPLFTGVNIEPATLARLAQIPNIVALKEEAGINPLQMTEYVQVVPKEFTFYCGDDVMVLQTLPQGAVGVVSGGAHVLGDMIRGMIDAYLTGQVGEASRLYYAMAPFFKALVQNGRINPIPLLKDAIRLSSGIDVGGPRLPSVGATPEEAETLSHVLGSMGRLAKTVGGGVRV